MKYIIFICFTISFQSVLALEFISCIDNNGQVHLTTMPKTSLDANCKQKTDHYTFMLEQDYSKLEKEFTKYEVTDEAEEGLVMNNLNEPILDALRTDSALDQLLENSDDNRESTASEFFRKRSDAVDSILSEEKDISPPGGL